MIKIYTPNQECQACQQCMLEIYNNVINISLIVINSFAKSMDFITPYVNQLNSYIMEFIKENNYFESYISQLNDYIKSHLSLLNNNIYNSACEQIGDNNCNQIIDVLFTLQKILIKFYIVFLDMIIDFLKFIIYILQNLNNIVNNWSILIIVTLLFSFLSSYTILYINRSKKNNDEKK